MKRTLQIAVLALLLVTGCKVFTDDNSIVNDSNIPVVLEAVGEVGSKIPGLPGDVILGGATALSVLWGAWQRVRTNKSESKYKRLENVAATVVQTIDEVSELTLSDNSRLGDTVKENVKKKLEKNETYLTSKAIISGLKAGAVSTKG